MSKKNNPKREDVIKISQELVRYDGDVDKVFEAINKRFSKDMINRIKNKRYMAAVSNLYFKKNTFNKNNNLDVIGDVVTTISPVAPSFEMNESSPSSPSRYTPAKSKKPKTLISEKAVRSICKYLVEFNGNTAATYEKTKHFENVNVGKIRDIKSKKSHKSISDEYFLKAFGRDKHKPDNTDSSTSCIITPKNESDQQLLIASDDSSLIQFNPVYKMSMEEFIDAAVEAFKRKPFDVVINVVRGMISEKPDEMLSVQPHVLFSDNSVQFDGLIRQVIMKMSVYEVLDMLRYEM